MSTKFWITLHNEVSCIFDRLVSMSSHWRWSSTDDTLLVFLYLLVVKRAALRCTISSFLVFMVLVPYRTAVVPIGPDYKKVGVWFCFLYADLQNSPQKSMCAICFLVDPINVGFPWQRWLELHSKVLYCLLKFQIVSLEFVWMPVGYSSSDDGEDTAFLGMELHAPLALPVSKCL